MLLFMSYSFSSLKGECDGELKLEVKISADMCNMYRIGSLAICFISP